MVIPRAHNSLSTSSRKLFHCHTVWNHKADNGDHACFQLTNEVRSSEVACRSQFLGKEQKAEWKVPGCIPEEYRRIILRSCFWMVLSHPLTAPWTKPPPGTAACANAPWRKIRTLACPSILEAEHKSMSQKQSGTRKTVIALTDTSRGWLHSHPLSCLTSSSHLLLLPNSYCLIMWPPCQKLVYSGAKKRDEEGRRQERVPTQTVLQSQVRRVSRLFKRRLNNPVGVFLVSHLFPLNSI